MRSFFVLLGRELGAYFHSAIAYVVLFFFLLLTGFTFYASAVTLNRVSTEVTLVEAFFNTVFFWFGFVLVFPLITMRLFSEEYKLGTIEPLMTAPIGDLQVVLAKYCASLALYAMLWLPSLLYFVVFESVVQREAAGAAGAYAGAYSMIFLIGAFYLSIGCLASALTHNQIVAGVMAFAAITLMFFMGLISMWVLSVSPFFQALVSYFSAIEHMAEYSRGIFDTRPVVLYLSMTTFVLFLTFHVFQRRRWAA